MRFLIALVVAWISVAARPEAGELPAPTGRPVLEVSGAIGRTNAPGKALFDLAMLEALGTRELVTTTPWTEGELRFSGVDPRSLLAAVEARGTELEITALDGYRAVVPLADLERFPTLLATRRDGRPMPVRERGPLWLVYPWSTHPETAGQPYRGRAVWQLRSIVVR
jgi:hypothetical protein